MCVISLVDDKSKRPTGEQVSKMFAANPSGAGIAWREKGEVIWRKGLDLPQITEMVAKVPIPFVAHFRIPSCGGKTPYLCHPFPVDKNVPLTLEGSTKGFVLFHNGHWGPWKASTLETVIRKGIKLPGGRWSDSRAMALAAYYYGIGVLDLIDEKAVAFGPTMIEVSGTGWERVEDCWYSNKGWSYRSGGSNYHNTHGNTSSYYTTPPYSMLPNDEDEEEEASQAVVVEEIKPSDNAGKGTAVLESKKRDSGGDPDVIPFDQAWRLYKDGKLTKKQFKKAKRAYENETRRARAGFMNVTH